MLSRSVLSASNWGKLQGKVAVVTGGGAGIGLMIAKGLVANGAKVYIADYRAEVAKKAARENGLTERFSLSLCSLHMDVTSKDSIANAAKVIAKTDGKLDILVNNAGVPGPTSAYLAGISPPEDETISKLLFRDHDFKSWTDVFAVNTFGPFFVTTGFLPLLEAASRTRYPIEGETSSVINISSAAGSLKSGMISIPYGTTKAALEHLTTVMAAEFSKNIRENDGLF
ncbi:NAD(P)-binding protein [Dendrothele bispora CBS 962.96]|uniref:NAD(P)-binding protein n=1 Tax=Dendrothele bispora (strain CBS 962.96) TaxID=1314807 RepID=A0A4S8L788_DENBC|nr:NAD(P)-binding protein [Dendrothele bispora CBS 962.96]